MAFQRKVKSKVQMASVRGNLMTTELVTSEELDKDGVLVKRAELKKVPCSEVSKKIVAPSDYTLENLLEAGVPLQEVPSKVFNTENVAQLQDRFGANAEKFLDVLHSMKLENETEVKTETKTEE